MHLGWGKSGKKKVSFEFPSIFVYFFEKDFEGFETTQKQRP